MGKYDALTPIVESSSPRETERTSSKARRVGKSANRQEYRQISVYIRRDLHNAAQRTLIGTEDDFSDLVNRLVQSWLGEQKS